MIVWVSDLTRLSRDPAGLASLRWHFAKQDVELTTGCAAGKTTWENSQLLNCPIRMEWLRAGGRCECTKRRTRALVPIAESLKLGGKRR